MEAQVSGVGLQVKRSELKTWLGNCVVFLGNSRAHRAQPHNYTKQQYLDHQAEKIWMYDRIQGATFDMHGQLYCRHTNAMALSSSPVVSALGSKSDNPRSSHGRGKALYP